MEPVALCALTVAILPRLVIVQSLRARSRNRSGLSAARAAQHSSQERRCLARQPLTLLPCGR